MKPISKLSSVALLALTALALFGTAQLSRGQAQAPSPPRSRADEMLDMWNLIGNKLIAMAQDFPEDKYDYKLQKDQRTFALNLLHAAALDFVLVRRISGSNLGPDFGEGDNPTRDQFKTKADVVKFVQEAVADGAKVIQEQGDAGLDKTTKFFGNRLAHNSHIWMFAIEHSAEHYGQLVVYYRANNLIPPDSRRQAQSAHPALAVRVVNLKTPGGTIVTASYFSPGKPGPQQSQEATTIASVLERAINGVEKQIVEVAEAMPEDKFNFSPESLNIPGADYKGVRTFAQQVKHVAASNYAIWSPLTSDTSPKDFMGGNGPENVKSKAEIIKFLKDSFALGHKVAATLTAQNMTQTPEHSKSSRLRLATFAVEHAFDHYGQMVEYLRMNGIVPPASRGKSD